MDTAYELSRVSLVSVLKVFSPIAFILGAIIGSVILLVFPSNKHRALTPRARLLSAAVFTLLWAAIVLSALTVIAILYNIVSNWLGGIVIHLKAL